MLFNSCCVNFYEEDFLLLFSSLWLLPGFPAATSAKQIRLHLKGNMLAYYTGVGEVGKSFEQQQHIDFLVMLSSFSSSALLILLFSSSSSSFSSPQIQKQFLNLQCSLEVWFFSPWFSSLLSFNGSFFLRPK